MVNYDKQSGVSLVITKYILFGNKQEVHYASVLLANCYAMPLSHLYKFKTLLMVYSIGDKFQYAELLW